MKYTKNFLSKVIFKVDFSSSFKGFKEDNPAFFDEIKLHFPIFIPKNNPSTEIKISSDGKFETSSSFVQELQFFNIDRTQKLLLTNNTIILEVDKYHDFEGIKNVFIGIINKLYELYNNDEINANRIEVRYVNNIFIEEDLQIFNWGKYISQKLLNLDSIIENKDNIIRSISVVELREDDYRLRFQYGLPNVDYPAKIIRNYFLLDFDAYYDWLLTKESIIQYLGKFHNKINELFEKSITDDLRTIMGQNYE